MNFCRCGREYKLISHTCVALQDLNILPHNCIKINIPKHFCICFKKAKKLTLIIVFVTGNQDCIDSYPCNWKGMYNGTINTTASGKTCLVWSNTYYSKYGQMNYCRSPIEDPASDKGPWCYIKGGGWEYCFVPLCSKYTQYLTLFYRSLISTPAFDICLFLLRPI